MKVLKLELIKYSIPIAILVLQELNEIRSGSYCYYLNNLDWVQTVKPSKGDGTIVRKASNKDYALTL